jgi:hypothetical protein
MGVTGPRVVRMPVRYQRPVDWADGVDEEIPLRTVKPFGARMEEVMWLHRPSKIGICSVQESPGINHPDAMNMTSALLMTFICPWRNTFATLPVGA